MRRQLVSDVPVAAFLLGGINSAAGGLENAVRRGRNPRLYHEHRDPRSDESVDAAAYAQVAGTHGHLERVTVDRAQTLVTDVIEACGEPFGDYSIIPTLTRIADSLRVISRWSCQVTGATNSSGVTSDA